MKNLNRILDEYRQDTSLQGGVDLDARLNVLLKDMRFAYFFQITIIGLIFVLALAGVVIFYRDSAIIASLSGLLGIGGIGWFLHEVRKSMREYTLIHLLISASNSLSPQQLDTLISAVRSAADGDAS